ncbi:MAG: hypothetical protein LAT67_05000 [Balneolales bacterium]|nr:hypothetical protein [Balneolales bacterium]
MRKPKTELDQENQLDQETYFVISEEEYELLQDKIRVLAAFTEVWYESDAAANREQVFAMYQLTKDMYDLYETKIPNQRLCDFLEDQNLSLTLSTSHQEAPETA